MGRSYTTAIPKLVCTGGTGKYGGGAAGLWTQEALSWHSPGELGEVTITVRPHHACRCLLLLAAWTGARVAHAEEVTVPVAVQADLLLKVASFDRNLPARSPDAVVVLIAGHSGSAEAERVTAQMRAALLDKPGPGGRPLRVASVPFSGATQLADACREQHAAVVYLTPGFSDAELTAIAEALASADVLSVGAVAEFVQRGVVLGFDLVSGKPKLLFQRTQARRQNVAIDASVLALMKVVE